MRILVTGGAGYIGSHTVLELAKRGHDVEILDNFLNSSRIAVERICELAGRSIPLHDMDARDSTKLTALFQAKEFDAVIHFAGYKAVGESVSDPLTYYDNNVGSTVAILKAMRFAGVRKFIFSSSATVYGTPERVPLTEDSRVGVGITNPYGHTKFIGEQIIADLVASDPTFEASVLRYFNPVGAHPTGLIGEDPGQTPNNLAPLISQVAVGTRSQVTVWGSDYSTPDGTGVRDYIHVLDLAEGHAAALDRSRRGLHVYNLGTGKGTSVLELISAFGIAADKMIPYSLAARRPGDVAECYADPSKASRELHWTATRTVAEAAADTLKWQFINPSGYQA